MSEQKRPTDSQHCLVRHNHTTRDIKPEGQCPACDHYHQAQKTFTPPGQEPIEKTIAKRPTEAIIGEPSPPLNPEGWGTPVQRHVELVFAGANLGGQSVYVCGKEAGEYGCGALVPESRLQQHRDWHTAYDIEFE